MPDFTSALYLGLRHPSAALGSWESLTLGRPAALRSPPGATAAAAELARLQGCEAAVLLPSTLHLFWDLFRVLCHVDGAVTILRDAGTYPIVRWGTERVASMGVPVKTFPHHDVQALVRLVDAAATDRTTPIIVVDGYCQRCGNTAPLKAYADIARRCAGYLVIDDTQALGILGAAPRPDNRYGQGGGGSLRWHDIRGPHLIVGSSLAKGFGVPVAALAGSGELIERFNHDSETRVHCSPPSVANVRAVHHALQMNKACGDSLRRRLMALVQRLRQGLVRAGLRALTQLPFPVQNFSPRQGMPVQQLHERLANAGIASLLTPACAAMAAVLTLIITTRHTAADIEQTARVIIHASTELRGRHERI